jgi:hypothetical protein
MLRELEPGAREEIAKRQPFSAQLARKSACTCVHARRDPRDRWLAAPQLGQDRGANLLRQ